MTFPDDALPEGETRQLHPTAGNPPSIRYRVLALWFPPCQHHTLLNISLDYAWWNRQHTSRTGTGRRRKEV